MTAKIKSLVFYVIMTPCPFYKNMLNCSYKNGALLAKFQPGVLNPFVLICGCFLYCLISTSYLAGLFDIFIFIFDRTVCVLVTFYQ